MNILIRRNLSRFFILSALLEKSICKCMSIYTRTWVKTRDWRNIEINSYTRVSQTFKSVETIFAGCFSGFLGEKWNFTHLRKHISNKKICFFGTKNNYIWVSKKFVSVFSHKKNSRRNKLLCSVVEALGTNYTVFKVEHETTGKIDIRRLTPKDGGGRRRNSINSNLWNGVTRPFRHENSCVTFIHTKYIVLSPTFICPSSYTGN